MFLKQKTQNHKSKLFGFALLNTSSDLGGVRTPNPQSRNLIFYPVELRGHFYRLLDFLIIRIIEKSNNRTIYIYTKSFLTMVEMVFPSAVPANCAEANPITFPMEAIPDAPVSAMILAMTASTSSSLN
jgi:hypothetical protein